MRRPILLTLFCLAAAGTLAASDRDHQALAQARQLQFEFRQGNLQVVEPLVRGLEAAVKHSADDADLWQALGNAYMSKQGVSFASSAEPAALIALGEKARDAYGRALARHENSALLRASHGMAGMSVAILKQDESGLTAALEEMNAAVRQAPRSTPVRLTRGFTIIHLPVAIRDTTAVMEDLNFILEVAPGERYEDVLHILLGDVYAELGQRDAARHEYVQVTGASRFAAEQSRARLKELKQGAISPAAIASVRAGLGYQCVMCHASGTDN